MVTNPTMAMPSTMISNETQWCKYCFLPKKIRAINAVITTVKPLIIWKTLPATVVRPMNNKLVDIMSKIAGIASNKSVLRFD
jgi:hypothetical protein